MQPLKEIRTRNLSKSFSGLTAVNSVDFRLENELCALIGPNGAGKTTFFDLITGELEPTAGSIEFRTDDGWLDITNKDISQITKLGLHRSYQLTNIFPGKTVLENVRIAAQAQSTDSFRIWRNVNAFEEYIQEAHQILNRTGLADQSEMTAENLSHGEKRQLEISIALAGDPDVLLLDEPSAGVSSDNVQDVINLIDEVAADHAVLLVEHNMDIVMSASERIVVLDQGEIIADDKPKEIRDNPAVQKSYLGTSEPGNPGGEGTSEAEGST